MFRILNFVDEDVANGFAAWREERHRVREVRRPVISEPKDERFFSRSNSSLPVSAAISRRGNLLLVRRVCPRRDERVRLRARRKLLA